MLGGTSEIVGDKTTDEEKEDVEELSEKIISDNRSD